MSTLPLAYGRLIHEDAVLLTQALAGEDLGEMHRVGLQVAERLAFRLAGIAFSQWWASGAEGAAAWPVQAPGAAYAMGHACSALRFCAPHAELVPHEKLALPAVGRLANARDSIAVAVRGVPAARLRTRRFDLAPAITSARERVRPRALDVALGEVLQLRNREAHIEGREDMWPDEHPDYLRLVAPLVAAAAQELLTHSQVTTPLAGLMVARLEAVSRTPDRARVPMIRFAPDAAGLQAAFFTHPGGLAAAATDPHMAAVAALPAPRLEELRPAFLVRHGRDVSQVVPSILFMDLSRGVPRDPVTGERLPLGAAQPSAAA